MKRSGRIRVAVLGGGMGGLAAAHALTRPELGGRCAVTVFQMGHRLGGKGASSRNPAKHQRIEEHGLHLWMGCYENAFRVMRDAYDALDRPAGTPLATWDEAFVPRELTVLQEHHAGRWTPWPQRFPVLPNRPGESDDVADAPEMLGAMLRWALDTVFWPAGRDDRWTPSAPGSSRVRDWVAPDLWLGAEGARRLAALGDGLEALLGDAWGDLSKEALPTMLRTARGLLDGMRRVVRLVFRGRLADPEARRAFITVDYILTNALGVIADRLVLAPDGGWARYGQWLDNLARIDHLDYRQWLRRHGADPATVDACIVRGLGDAVFSSASAGSAGSALNGLVRLNLTYRGSVFLQMQAGMGETVFTPLYQALRARGVAFRFFHRVDRLRLDPHRQRVVGVDLAEQVGLRGAEYHPLVDVPHPKGNLPCWPVHPDWAQLDARPELRAVDLESPAPVPGERRFTYTDFDAVVLAIPVGALAPIVPELAAARPEWGGMLAALKTTATLSAQLWFDRTVDELGWPHGNAVCTAYADPLDTWAEMSHLLEAEGYGDGAKQCSYLVGSVPTDAVDPVKTTDDWLHANLRHILPGAMTRDGVDRGRIVDVYHRLNTKPSERYVLSVPGSTGARLRPHLSGFDNLMLAGDWCRTGLNVGSIEAATMAGLKAAQGVLQDTETLVGDYED